MVIRIHLIHPKLGDCGPIEDGVTHRAASWPTRESAQEIADHWNRCRSWNHLRDDWTYEARIIDTKEQPCTETTTSDPRSESCSESRSEP